MREVFRERMNSRLDEYFTASPAQRQAVLYGWYGQTVNVTDGKHTYFRAPTAEDNQPLYRYFLTPGSFSMRNVCGKGFYDQAELGHAGADDGDQLAEPDDGVAPEAGQPAGRGLGLWTHVVLGSGTVRRLSRSLLLLHRIAPEAIPWEGGSWRKGYRGP